MQEAGRLSLATVSHGQRSRPGTNSYSPAGIHRTQTTVAGHSTDHGYHLPNNQSIKKIEDFTQTARFIAWNKKVIPFSEL